MCRTRNSHCIICTARKNKNASTSATSEQSARFKSFFKEAAVDASQTKKISSSRKKQLDEAFVKMMVLDYQPLTLGERQGMRHFANCAVPGYVTPCYSTVTDTLLPAAMKEVEEQVESALRGNRNFTIATDIWTSRRGHPFIAFICTYINENFEGKAMLLGCNHMPGHHTGDSIYAIFDLCVKKWKIDDSIIRVVSDNASNMLSAFRLPGFTKEFEVLFSKTVPSATASSSEIEEGTSGNFVTTDTECPDSAELEMTCDEIQESDNDGETDPESNIESAVESAFFTSKLHLPCPIHTTQLAIKDSFDECDDIAALTTKVSKLVSNIRRSTLNTTFTDGLGVQPSVACVTRWNSQLKMIESVLKLSERDADFQSKLSIQQAAKLSATDLRLLASLVQVLQPLAELTDTLQTEFGTLGAVLPAVAEVQALLGNVKSPIAMRIFAETLAKKFEERFQKYYSDVQLTVAAVLDPRFKTEWIMRDKNVRDQILAIRSLVAHNASQLAANTALASDDSNEMAQARASATQTSTDVSVSKKPRLMFASYSTQLSAQETPSTFSRTADDELDEYLSSPRLPPTADVLTFWRANASIFPQLAQLARATYGIPSGSASAERCFSAAGLITRVHRLSLKPKTLEKLVFHKVNSALLKLRL